MTEAKAAVFLSYASQDAEAAARICAALRDAGIDVWFDRSALRGGDTWDSEIRRQIKLCALFVPIISKHTHSREEGYFRLEWKLAVDRSYLMAATKAFLLPVVIDDTRDDDDTVPDRFREVHWTHLSDGAPTKAFVERVARLLSPAPSPDAAAPSVFYSDHPSAGRAGFATIPRQKPWLQNKTLLAVVGLLVAASGYFAIDRIVLSRRALAAHAVPLEQRASGEARTISEKSIAVLPFVDMSEKRDQEYFSDGLAEELLELLSQTPGLHVIARTSSFYFKGKQATVGEIAKTLGVGNVLEGSVRKSGNRLRVTTQLVRGDNGEHIWSETYDRDQRDVFQIQDDIARAVVDKLRLTLLGGALRSEAATSNSEVHNLYLRGRYLVSFDTAEATAQAVVCFHRAIALEAGYAPAWAGLANAIDRQVANGYVPAQAGRSEAMAAARKAVDLDPTLPEGYIMVGVLKMAMNFDWPGAREAFDHALRVDPNSTDAQFRSAHLTMTVGSTDDTLVQFRHVLDRDPLNLLWRRYVARVFYYAGRLDEAEATIREVLAISPSFPAAHYELGRILLARNQTPQAVTEFEAEKSNWDVVGLPLGYYAAGRTSEADAALKALLMESAGSEFQVAEAYAFFGNLDQAFVWLDHAVERRDSGLQWLRGDPLLKSLTKDPRYGALLRRLNMPT